MTIVAKLIVDHHRQLKGARFCRLMYLLGDSGGVNGGFINYGAFFHSDFVMDRGLSSSLCAFDFEPWCKCRTIAKRATSNLTKCGTLSHRIDLLPPFMVGFFRFCVDEPEYMWRWGICSGIYDIESCIALERATRYTEPTEVCCMAGVIACLLFDACEHTQHIRVSSRTFRISKDGRPQQSPTTFDCPSTVKIQR